MNEWINEWINKWMNEQMNEWMNGIIIVIPVIRFRVSSSWMYCYLNGLPFAFSFIATFSSQWYFVAILPRRDTLLYSFSRLHGVLLYSLFGQMFTNHVLCAGTMWWELGTRWGGQRSTWMHHHPFHKPLMHGSRSFRVVIFCNEPCCNACLHLSIFAYASINYLE